MFFIVALFPQKVNEGSKSKSLRIPQNSREIVPRDDSQPKADQPTAENVRQTVKPIVPPRRLERPTSGLGNRCSIHLSYGGYEIL